MMKIPCADLDGKRKRFHAVVITAMLLFLSNLIAYSQTTQNSPVGTWDMVISGDQQGVAFLTFFKDNTIGGFEIISQNLQTGTTTTTGTANTGKNPVFFGYWPITGEWQFGARGNVIGFFVEVGATDELTMGSSFAATVTPGRKLIMNVLDGSPYLNPLLVRPRWRIYSGFPIAQPRAINGKWYSFGKSIPADPADKTRSAQAFTEFQTITGMKAMLTKFPDYFKNHPLMAAFEPILNSPAVDHCFFVSGAGPDYDISGLALLSNQNSVAIVSGLTSYNLDNTPTRILSSVTGPIYFSPPQEKASMGGNNEILATDAKFPWNGISKGSSKVSYNAAKALFP